MVQAQIDMAKLQAELDNLESETIKNLSETERNYGSDTIMVSLLDGRFI